MMEYLLIGIVCILTSFVGSFMGGFLGNYLKNKENVFVPNQTRSPLGDTLKNIMEKQNAKEEEEKTVEYYAKQWLGMGEDK